MRVNLLIILDIIIFDMIKFIINSCVCHFKMKISQAVLFPLVVLIGFIFSSQTKAQQEPLRIISSASPYVSQVFDQLTIEIFKRLDVPLSLVKEEAGERAISSANQGIYDGDGLRVADIITPIFPNLIQVPESYIRLNFVAFSK